MSPDQASSPIKPVVDAAQQAARHETAPGRVRRLRIVLFQVYLLAAVAGFSVLAFLASTTAYLPVDLAITRAVQLLRFAGFAPLMVAISWFGFLPQTAIGIAAVCILLYLLGLHWEAYYSLLVVAVEALINLFIKVVIHRPRPSPNLVHVLANLRSYSFPSGHVMLYTTYFGFLLFLAYALLRRSWKRTLLMVIFGGLILLVGLSRVFEGEHWASDVLGGYLAGSLILAAAIYVYRWGKGKFSPRQPTAPVPADEIHKNSQN